MSEYIVTTISYEACEACERWWSLRVVVGFT